MSDDNKQPKIGYDERISACRALAAELKDKGIRCEPWTSPAKNGNDPGTGVALYDKDGEQQANVTVDSSSIIRVRQVRTTLPGTKLAATFAEALGIEVTAFIPDGKYVKAKDAFGAFRKFTKRFEE